jgi:LPS-assembly lipoprotein
MSSPETRRLARLGCALALSLALAGCFRPVYGGGGATTVTADKTVSGDVESRMKSVDVKPIEGRVGGKLRNELIFLLRGGAAKGATAYRLEISPLIEDGQAAVVDPLTNVQETRTISLRATFKLYPAGSLDPIFTADTVAIATYFSGLQRFANVRAARDAEDRAATQIAERIRTRVQGYFAAGR